MAVEKISVSLPDHVATRARRAAERAGMPLSTWLAEAAEAAASLDDARAALEEYEAQFGTPTPEEIAETDAMLAAAGVFEPETPEERASRLAALARLRGLTDERRTG